MLKNALLPFKVVHSRLTPKRYSFTHHFFWFKLNLDKPEKLPLLSFNKFNFYSFYDSDHIKFGHEKARDNYIEFAQKSGLKTPIKSVTVYTQLRTLGYVFNPVSFVSLIDEEDKQHAIIEIGNTFNEQKPYFVHNDHFDGNSFEYETTKYFYISPFIEHDNKMLFKFMSKEGRVTISIDDFKDKERVLYVHFDGQEIELTAKNLFLQTIKNPFVTIQFIVFIHLHAFILWMKGIKYFKKDEFMSLQKGAQKWKV